MNAKPMLALTAALWLGTSLSGCSDGDDDSQEAAANSGQSQSQSAEDSSQTAQVDAAVATDAKAEPAAEPDADANAENRAEDSTEEPTEDAPAQASGERTKALEDALRTNFDPQLGEVRYLLGWADLNDDASDEAIVHVVGPMVCGTGGCDTLVLQAQDDTYRVISALATTEPPIHLGSESHNGWQDLLVTRRGDDTAREEVVVRFDGDAYVESDASASAEGQQLIAPFESMEDATPLFTGAGDGTTPGSSEASDEEEGGTAEPTETPDEASAGDEAALASDAERTAPGEQDEDAATPDADREPATEGDDPQTGS